MAAEAAQKREIIVGRTQQPNSHPTLLLDHASALTLLRPLHLISPAHEARALLLCFEDSFVKIFRLEKGIKYMQGWLVSGPGGR